MVVVVVDENGCNQKVEFIVVLWNGSGVCACRGFSGMGGED